MVEQKADRQAPITDSVDLMMQKESVSPELQEKMDAYAMALMHVVHSDETNGSVVDMLKSGPPEQSIPRTANQVNAMVEKNLENKGKKTEDSVKMAGALYLVTDLIELGNAAQAWDEAIPQEQMPKYFQGTLQQYIHEGIKNGTIDPIELQAQVEPLLNDKQRQIGEQSAQALGLPGMPTASMGIDAYTQKQMKPLQDENAQLKSMLDQQGGKPNGV